MTLEPLVVAVVVGVAAVLAFFAGVVDARRRAGLWHALAGWDELERTRRELATERAIVRAQIEHRALREADYSQLLARWKAEQAARTLLEARLVDVSLSLDPVVAWVDRTWPRGIGDAHDSDHQETRLDARTARAIVQAHTRADAPLGEVAA